jgi:hypothetical protein
MTSLKDGESPAPTLDMNAIGLMTSPATKPIDEAPLTPQGAAAETLGAWGRRNSAPS